MAKRPRKRPLSVTSPGVHVGARDVGRMLLLGSTILAGVLETLDEAGSTGDLPAAAKRSIARAKRRVAKIREAEAEEGE